MLKAAGLDGYVCLSALEMRYFTGVDLAAEEAVLLLGARKAYCVTKQMMLAKLTGIEKEFALVSAPGDMLAGALDLAVQKKMLRLAFNPAGADFVRGEYLSRAGLARMDGVVEEMRRVKYADETALIQKACRIAAAAFKEVKPKIKTGMSEEDVRILMAVAMISRGAESIPFNIVCFGENCADCHHTPSEKRKLKAHDAILMDFGCFYKGYCSDMTRSWWHGGKEPAEYRKIWHLVKMAKDAVAQQLRAGLPAAAADKTARDIIEDAGYGSYYIHSTGHAIGQEVHEAPVLRANSTEEIEENAVVTIEPGIYLPGKFGVRLEDSYLVGKTQAKNLTQN